MTYQAVQDRGTGTVEEQRQAVESVVCRAGTGGRIEVVAAWRERSEIAARTPGDLKRRLSECPSQMLSSEIHIHREPFWAVIDLSIMAQQWYGVTYRSPELYRLPLLECGFISISHSHTYRYFQSLLDDFGTDLNETLFTANFMDAYCPRELGTF